MLAAGARWRKANRERHQYLRKRYYAKHREKWTEYGQQYRKRYPEKYKAQIRRRYARNRPVLLARAKAYRQAHPEQRRALYRAWVAANREIVREYGRRRRAAKKQAAIGEITPELVLAKLVYWGWRCWLCGGEWETWDHVKPLTKGGAHCLANLRPACRRCNSTKRDTWPFPTHRRR